MSLSITLSNSDFDFFRDKTNRLVAFIFGFLMYSVTIAVMSAFFTHNLISNWSNTLNGHMTIEFQSNIDGNDETLTEKQKEDIINILRATDGIKSVKRLQESDILKILEPWLKSTSIPDDFPFPTLFDVDTDRNAKIDLLLLTERLSKISPMVKIHDHSNWYTPILKISNSLFFFAILLSVLIFATVCSTVIFITKKTLGVHKDIVKILQLIGAHNMYIASQFKQYYFLLALKASFISIILGLMTIVYMSFMLFSGFDINTLKYIFILFIILIITTIIIIVTAKTAVMFFLANDEKVE